MKEVTQRQITARNSIEAKTIALILTGTLVTSSISVPAFADEVTPTAQPTPIEKVVDDVDVPTIPNFEKVETPAVPDDVNTPQTPEAGTPADSATPENPSGNTDGEEMDGLGTPESDDLLGNDTTSDVPAVITLDEENATTGTDGTEEGEGEQPGEVVDENASRFDELTGTLTIMPVDGNTVFDGTFVIDGETKSVADFNATTIVLGEGFETIGVAAFSPNYGGLPALETVVLSASVNAIGEYAFYGCTNLKNVGAVGASGIVLNGVSLSFYAFGDCASIPAITLTGSAGQVIPASVFDGCHPTALSVSGYDVLEADTFIGLAFNTVSVSHVGTIKQGAFSSITAGSIVLDSIGVCEQGAFVGVNAPDGLSLTFKNMSIGTTPLEGVSGEVNLVLNNVNGPDGTCGYTKSSFAGLDINSVTTDEKTNTSEWLPGKEHIMDFSEDAQLDFTVTESFTDAPSVGYTNAVAGTDSNNAVQIKYQAGWTANGSASATVSADFAYSQQGKQYVFVLDMSKEVLNADNTGRTKLETIKSKLNETTTKLLQPGTGASITYKVVDSAGENDIAKVYGPFYSDPYDPALGLDGAKAAIKSFMPNQNITSADTANNLARAAADSATGPGVTAIVISAADALNIGKPPYTELALAGNNSTVFAQMVNKAITSNCQQYTVTIPIDSAFTVDANSIKPTVGSAYYDEAANAIMWTVDGLPSMKHNITFTQTLRNTGQSGTYTLCAGGIVAESADGVLLELSTQAVSLNYSAPQVTAPAGSGAGGYTLRTTRTTPVVLPTEETTVITDDANPLAANALAGTVESIADDETPMIGAPSKGVTAGQLALLLGIAGIAIIGAALVLPRLGFSRKVKNM